MQVTQIAHGPNQGLEIYIYLYACLSLSNVLYKSSNLQPIYVQMLGNSCTNPHGGREGFNRPGAASER